MNTYIIYKDSLGNPDRMYEFVGSYRALLEHLNGITDENRNEPTDFDDPHSPKFGELPDEALEARFIADNGNGQPWFAVYDYMNHKRILTEGHP